MQLLFHIETHVYSEGVLREQYFERTDNCGILLPDDFATLLKFRDNWTKFEFDKDTTIGEVRDKVINYIVNGIDSSQPYQHNYADIYKHRFFFVADGNRFAIENDNALFAEVLSKYLDTHNTNTVWVSILASADAGEVWSEKNLRFYMRSHEGNRHNTPHVHVTDTHTRQEASISIIERDFPVLAGSLPQKAEKAARRLIREKQEFFIHCWNTKTDGLNVDINHALKLIDY